MKPVAPVTKYDMARPYSRECVAGAAWIVARSRPTSRGPRLRAPLVARAPEHDLVPARHRGAAAGLLHRLARRRLVRVVVPGLAVLPRLVGLRLCGGPGGTGVGGVGGVVKVGLERCLRSERGALLQTGVRGLRRHLE